MKAKVAIGMYNSVSEVMREALLLMEERGAMQAMKLMMLRQEINQDLTSIGRG